MVPKKRISEKVLRYWITKFALVRLDYGFFDGIPLAIVKKYIPVWFIRYMLRKGWVKLFVVNGESWLINNPKGVKTCKK